MIPIISTHSSLLLVFLHGSYWTILTSSDFVEFRNHNGIKHSIPHHTTWLLMARSKGLSVPSKRPWRQEDVMPSKFLALALNGTTLNNGHSSLWIDHGTLAYLYTHLDLLKPDVYKLFISIRWQWTRSLKRSQLVIVRNFGPGDDRMCGDWISYKDIAE